MTGRGGSASVRVKAGLDDMAVHVCGNLMNHNSMYLVDVWPGMDRGGDGGGRGHFPSTTNLDSSSKTQDVCSIFTFIWRYSVVMRVELKSLWHMARVWVCTTYSTTKQREDPASTP